MQAMEARLEQSLQQQATRRASLRRNLLQGVGLLDACRTMASALQHRETVRPARPQSAKSKDGKSAWRDSAGCEALSAESQPGTGATVVGNSPQRICHTK